jgi:hypothetical protein
VSTRGGPISQFLARDHERLDALLRRALAEPDRLDMEAYEEFRRGLLRHIAMEEKVLIPEAKRIRGEAPAVAKQLRADHSALAALLVPTPTHEILRAIAGILEEHNPLEEDPGGLYEVCEEITGDGAAAVLARIEAVPEVPTAAHFDGPRVHEHIANLLRARAARER